LKQADEEKQKLISKFEALIKEPWASNVKYLKLLEIQPSGKTIAENMSFPSCKEDFGILKNLGKDLFSTTFIAYFSYPHIPVYTTGVELSFKNGIKKLLGAKDIG
jgi:hypothetical protein